ncbi:hypothetical protein E5985_10430 [Muribaculaceae bacterium]|nr:hypothetical protein E5985_10430 [Muribaculaceae bacterium]
MTTMAIDKKVLNVPHLRFPEFTEEWVNVSLKDVADFQKERISSGLLDESTYISTENILQNFQGVQSAISIPANTNVIAYKKNDILLSNIRPYLKKVWFSDRIGGCSADVFVLRSKTCEPEFLYNVIASDKFINYVMSGAKGVKMPRGDKNQMGSFSFSIPAVAEQRKISRLFQLLDERIATQNKIIEDLKKLKSAISQIIFRNTTLVKIQNLCEVIMGQSPSSSSYNSNNDGLPLIQGNLDILDGITISRIYTNEPTKISLQKDLILTVRAPVGIVAENKMKVCIGRGVCALRNKSVIPTMYIYYALDYFSYKWKQIEQGSTFTSINGDDVKNFTIPLVGDVEYSCAFLSKVDALIKCSIDLHSNYIKQKQYLLSQLFI